MPKFDGPEEAARRFFMDNVYPRIRSFSTEDVRDDPSNPDLVTGKRMILNLELTPAEHQSRREQAYYTRMARRRSA